MTTNNRSNSQMSDLSDYCLDRLFDPEQLYYTPMEDLIKRYKKVDLMIGRMFNLSKKYGHVPKIRTRVINAPQMERANIRILGYENFYYPPPKVQLCTELNEKYRKDDQRVLSGDSSESEDESKEDKYEDWLIKRKTLRSGLDGFDLNVEYLKRKKDLSEIEKRILRKMMFSEIGCQTDTIVEKNPKKLSKNSANNPKIVYPTPIVMESIEEFLEINKWRLIDLFRDLDKDKDWLVLKSDLIRQVLKGRLKANESMIDELIFVLGSTKTNSIDYKSLRSGRISHLLKKRKEDSSEYEDEFVPKELQLRSTSKMSKKTLSSERLGSVKSYGLDSSLDDRLPSERISSSKSSINHLQLPKIDARPEAFPNSNSVSREISVDSMTNFKTITKNEKTKLTKLVRVEEKEKFDTKSKMNEIRNKAIKELEICLQKPELIKRVDSKKLKKALGLPYEFKLNEIKFKTNHS